MIFAPMAMGVSLCFLIAFLWASRSGQFDDLDTPSQRMLYED